MKTKPATAPRGEQAPWMASLGKLKDLQEESAHILRVTEEEFETIESEE